MYDLVKNASIRLQHGCWAREYGIDAFAYHHYWFYDKNNPHPALSGPLEAMLVDGEPNLPFMLHWANHPWTNSWSGDTEKKEETLQAQYFPGPEEMENVTTHYKFLRRFFKHKNYVLVKGCPVFMVVFNNYKKTFLAIIFLFT